MIPKAGLIILIVAAAVASITFLIAIYEAISNHIRSRKLRASKQSDESTLPLTEAAGVPGIIPNSVPIPALISAAQVPTTVLHPPTPEAESPPPLPNDLGLEDLVEAESPPPLPRERDSMHEIIDLYSNESRNLPPAPISAPARILTFAQAESKWAYFGAKRAEMLDRGELHIV